MGKKSEKQFDKSQVTLPNPQTCPIILDLCQKLDGEESPLCGDAVLTLSGLLMYTKGAGDEKLAEKIKTIVNSCGNACYRRNVEKYSCKVSIETYNQIKEELKKYVEKVVKSPSEPMPGAGN